MNHTPTTTKKSIDPVCGMAVESESAVFHIESGGATYFFCAEGCRRAFAADSERYLNPAPAKPKRIWGRYLERLNKATGGRPPCCH